MKDIKIFQSLDDNAANSAYDQVKTKLMSGFVGAEGNQFYGGDFIKKFETESCKIFQFEHAITVNSWTSGLLLMLQSLDIDEADAEIIVTPWTMSATIFVIIQAGFIPVFVDIEESSFMPSVENINNAVTNKTRAIMLADIFGQSYPYEKLNHLQKKGIKIISDAAQSHLAFRHKKPVGYLADVTGISLNRHKHINTGEGGIILTNNNKIAEYCRQSRNHGENLNFSINRFKNMIGYNFRLTETQAAVGSSQLKLLPKIVESRQKLASIAIKFIQESNYFDNVLPLPGNTHSYYIFPILIKKEYRRRGFLEHIRNYMLSKNLPSPSIGYQNIHKLDFFQNPKATSGMYSKYCTKPFCPVAEELHLKGFLGILFCNHEYDEDNIVYYLESLNQAAIEY